MTASAAHVKEFTARKTSDFSRTVRAGFTIIEMIIVVGIVTVILAALLPRIFDTAQGDYTKHDAEDALNLMMTAQTFAATGRDDSHWGIHLVDNGTTDCKSTTSKDCLVLYKGTVFSSRDQSYDQVFTLHGTNRWANTDDSDFYFQKLSGNAHGLYGFPSDAVGYWPFTASTTINIAATGTPGTISGGVAYIINGCANNSGCFNFDYLYPGYINEGDNSNLNVGTGDFTIAAWVNRLDFTCDAMHIAGKRLSGATGSWYRIYDDNGSSCGADALFTFEIANSYPTNYTQIQASLVNGQSIWHHVVGRRQSGTLNLFVDGTQQAATQSSITWNLDNTGWFGIGRYAAASDYYAGRIDDVMLFKRALSSDEISQIFTSTRPTSTAPGERTSQAIKITNGLVTSTIKLFSNGTGYVLSN